jgi:hypothetical protein
MWRSGSCGASQDPLVALVFIPCPSEESTQTMVAIWCTLGYWKLEHTIRFTDLKYKSNWQMCSLTKVTLLLLQCTSALSAVSRVTVHCPPIDHTLIHLVHLRIVAHVSKAPLGWPNRLSQRRARSNDDWRA